MKNHWWSPDKIIRIWWNIIQLAFLINSLKGSYPLLTLYSVCVTNSWVRIVLGKQRIFIFARIRSEQSVEVGRENLRQSDHSTMPCWPIRGGYRGEEPQLSHAGPGEQFRSWKCLPASEGRSQSKHGQSQELRHNGNCLTSVKFPPQPLSPGPDPQLAIRWDYRNRNQQREILENVFCKNF